MRYERRLGGLRPPRDIGPRAAGHVFRDYRWHAVDQTSTSGRRWPCNVEGLRRWLPDMHLDPVRVKCQGATVVGPLESQAGLSTPLAAAGSGPCGLPAHRRT